MCCDVSLLHGNSAIASWLNRRSVSIMGDGSGQPAERKKQGGSERGRDASLSFFVVLREQSKMDEK